VRALLLACLLSVSVWPAETDLSRQLKAVEARYNSATSLQVLFYEDFTPAGRIHKSDAGTLTLSKPGKMRWEYSQPKGKLWVADGKTSWRLFPDENRVEHGPIKESDDLGAPLAFLLGRLHFDKEFRNLQAKPVGAGLTRVSADPKSDNLPYEHVEFVINSQNQIVEVKAIGIDKSLMLYRFDEEKLNVAVDPKLFQFKIPAGAEVVEMGK
jgi:outer membrane lipoprotein-sorting protein